jgi:hypothetical protein
MHPTPTRILLRKAYDEIRRARHLGSLNLLWKVRDNLTVNANAQHNGKQTDIGGVTLGRLYFSELEC